MPRRFLLRVLGRHLAREFLGAFALALGAFVLIFLTAEFFDRLDSFLRHDAPAGAIVRFFVFRIPLVVTQAMPAAALVGGLVGLGLLARQNEFVALRACGVSVWHIAAPLLGHGDLLSVGVFVWNETVVPYSARRWHTIENTEIKKRRTSGVFAGREVWYHGRAGFTTSIA
jgi:lipopolysaccharide export system permease protein